MQQRRCNVFVIPDEYRSEFADDEQFESMLADLAASDRIGPVDRTIVCFALHVLRRMRQSIRAAGEAPQPHDVVLSKESFASVRPGSADAHDSAIALARWAAAFALADRGAVFDAETIARRFPWLAWILPATVRWIRLVSSADYFEEVPVEAHRVALSHMIAVEQDHATPEYLATLLAEYRQRIEG